MAINDANTLEDLRLLLDDRYHEPATMSLFGALVQNTTDPTLKLLYVDHMRHYFFYDPYLAIASKHLRDVLAHGGERAGVALVLKYIIEDQTSRIPVSRAVSILTESTALAPDCVWNRLCLAECLDEAGRSAEAMRELEHAQRNLRPRNNDEPRGDWVREEFEAAITGRWAEWLATDITERIASLRRKERG